MKKILLSISLSIMTLALSLGQIKLEAEDGVVTGASVSSEVAGYSGTGYVVFTDAAAKVEVSVDVETAGLYYLALGFRSEYGEKTQDLHVNGAMVESIVFPTSATFSTIEIGEVSLNAGSNTIAIVKNWGYMDIDYFAIATEAVVSTLPVADAGSEQVKMDTNGDGNEVFILDASASSDPDENIVSYKWLFANGDLAGTTAQLEVEAALGATAFTLEVEDADGNIDVDEVKVFVGDPTNNGNQFITLPTGDQLVFANGINLAWDDFAKDVVELDASYFEGVLNSIEAAGGNAMRWWLHTNGSSSPNFDSQGNVTGLDPNTIPNMRAVLDMAYNRGIVISMCLWSFDMLQPQGQDQQMMKSFVESKEKTQTYIDKALIPILEEIGTHPAVLTWEIFNEAEGMTQEFGWTPVKTQMKFVQQFVNLTAGAIHRTVPSALVSTGSWSFKALTDIEGNTNYYRDDRLIAAGGDEDGVLDFYQVHYYPEHFGNDLSPFHRPADWWGLDKPILIGEFPTSKIDGKADPYYTTTEAYKIAYEYGYSGAMSWDFRGFGGGSFETAKEGITYLAETYPEVVNLEIDPDLINNPPSKTGSIPDINFLFGTAGNVQNHASLDTVFFDQDEGDVLSYSISENTNPALATAEISPEGILNVLIVEEQGGQAEITIKARDNDGASTSATFKVNIREANNNLALFKPAVASSEENEEHAIDFANDGDMDTRWSSTYEDNQWIYVNLEAPTEISLIKIFWEAAFAKSYEIQISDDGVNWVTVFTETDGNGGEDIISIEHVNTQYVRINAVERATAFGFSIWEIEIYNEIATSVADHAVRLSLFPNPVKGNSITLEVFDPSPVRVEFLDLLGNNFEAYQLSGALSYEMNISKLPDGVSLILISTNNGISIHKIIKQ